MGGTGWNRIAPGELVGMYQRSPKLGEEVFSDASVIVYI